MASSASPTNPHGQTKNQHFVSQVEQRLNALNPCARRMSQRIYGFEIVNREQHQVRLISPKGRLISNALSMFDLFSLDVFHRRIIEQSFERIFSSGLAPHSVTVIGGP